MRRIVIALLACSGLLGCATSPQEPPAPSLLNMQGSDEAQAAALLGAYLVARGCTVRLAGEASVEASDREGAGFMIEVLLDPSGLDRLLVSRQYVVKEGVDPGRIGAFAAELNGLLNVGVFSAYPPGILYQSALPFVDAVDPVVLDAFIDFTRDVEIAVRQVEAGRGLLVEVEGATGSR
jgi:hypothetical protein